jgi:hypothetical protein
MQICFTTEFRNYRAKVGIIKERKKYTIIDEETDTHHYNRKIPN